MRLPGALLVLLLPVFAFSQEKKLQKSYLKFGDIKAADFEPSVYEVDSSASAVVLADIGQSEFEGNNDGFFDIIFKHHKRIRVMNKNGFDAATVSINIYHGSSGKEEKLEDLEAVTYNLENGKVVATKLEKGSMFKDKINRYYSVRKFTFPNIKEGSILEFRYKIVNPFFQLRNWDFQGSLPRLWSEYSVSVPAMFDYVLITQGNRQFDISDAKMSSDRFNILVPADNAYDRSEVVGLNLNVFNNVWAVKDMPALKQEAYTTTTENHIQKIEFQLRSIRWPSGKVEDVMGSWTKLAESMLKDEEFGADLGKNNGFFDGELNKAIATATTDKEKIRLIYQYVRDNYTCTNHSAIWMSNPMKKTFQAKNGNVADINLMLTAMLRSKGFDAQPVILSTTDNGKAYELYPIRSRFNYVITRVKLPEGEILLDASRQRLGFGKLPADLYNGYARIVEAPIPTLISLSPDSLKESKITSIFIANEENGKGLTGSYTSNLGDMESYGLREELKKTTMDEYFKSIKKRYSFEITMENTNVEALNNFENPVAVKYDFKFPVEDELIYLNPMFTEAMKENPFSAAERQYPVEMPYRVNETFVLNMEIPKGYKVEELPKSTRLKLNDDEGMYEYIIAANETHIQLRSRLSLNKATFSKEDYQTLREFFAMLVKKQAEQVVLKKIN